MPNDTDECEHGQTAFNCYDCMKQQEEDNPEYLKVSLEDFLKNPKRWLYDTYMADGGCFLSASIRKEIADAVQFKQAIQKIDLDGLIKTLQVYSDKEDEFITKLKFALKFIRTDAS